MPAAPDRDGPQDAGGDPDWSSLLAPLLGSAPFPCAVTLEPSHTLIYANQALLRLIDPPESLEGTPIGELILAEGSARLGPLLDRVGASGRGLSDQFLGRLKGSSGSWSCSIWPVDSAPNGSTALAIGLRRVTPGELSATLQREVTERLLLSALREAEIADIAEAARDRTSFLVEAGRRLGASLDEDVTRGTVARIAMPALGAWCFVDLIEPNGTLTRLAMVHPDPDKQEVVRELARDWAPRPGDPFGAPVVMGNAQPAITKVEMVDMGEALAAAAHTAENLRLLGELVIGPLLTVPLVSHGKLWGAVTFVSGQPNRSYSREDVELAEGLAARSADALSSARLYGDAVVLREHAEAMSETRMRFLGNISHELRTPLNAISGYAELMEEGIHGPITPMQRRDLERIRWNQQHLLVLITDILNFVRAGVAREGKTVPVPVAPAVVHVLSLLEALANKKSIHLRNEAAEPDIVADADPDSVQQILINLVANAVKFTPWEGTIMVRSAVSGDTVELSVTDTGMGIDPEKVEAIFEPFVQIPGEAVGGVGLGLAISRDLARAMRGEITVESTPGEGSCFTVTLPRRLDGAPVPLG